MQSHVTLLASFCKIMAVSRIPNKENTQPSNIHVFYQLILKSFINNFILLTCAPEDPAHNGREEEGWLIACHIDHQSNQPDTNANDPLKEHA